MTSQPLESPTQTAMASLESWVTEEIGGNLRYGYKIKNRLFSGQSDFQTVEVVETEAFGRMLLLDGAVMTTERDEYIYHEMITHVPLLTHPCPRNVLVIGGGDGGTVREVLKHPDVETVVLCEIDGMVVDVSREYLPTIAACLDEPRVDLQILDGIAFMKTKQAAYDVVIVDSADPIGPGVGLFTEAFYQDVFNALRPGGIMVNQSESPFVTPKGTAAVYALLKKVFPLVAPYTGTIPTYPGGYWTWTYCSKPGAEYPKGRGPLEGLNEGLASQLEKSTRYYNREIHQAAFALPNFLRQQLNLSAS